VLGAALVGGILLPRSSSVIGDHYVEGIHYARIAHPTGEPSNHVRAWFWWGCPHCHRFEPLLLAWRHAMADTIEFERSALPASKKMIAHATLFLALKDLGWLDDVHQDFFDAAQRGPLGPTQVDEILSDHNLPSGVFWPQLSQSSQASISSLSELAARTGVKEVPSVVVGGRYRVIGRAARSYEQMLDIARHLANLPA
jgi:thiol:disulfide interchange protein DsbA